MKILMNCAFVLLALSGTCLAQTTTGNRNNSMTAKQFINQAAISGMKEVATGKLAKVNAQDARIKSFGMMMVGDHTKVNEELKLLARSKNIKFPKPYTGNMPGRNAGRTGNIPTVGTTGSGTTGTTGTIGTTGNVTTSTSETTGTTGNADATGTASTSSTIGTTSNTAIIGNKNNTTGTLDARTGTGRTMGIGTDSLKLLTEQDVSMAVQQLSNLKGTAFDSTYTQMMIDDHKNAIILFERGAQSSDPKIKTFAAKHLPTLRNHLMQITGIKNGSGQP